MAAQLLELRRLQAVRGAEPAQVLALPSWPSARAIPASSSHHLRPIRASPWSFVRRAGDYPRVPRISFFYGIVIAMYYRDHQPPHFHAIYGEHEAQIVISTLDPLTGELPQRALRLVREWGSLHQLELETNWAKARTGEPLDKIEPLA